MNLKRFKFWEKQEAVALAKPAGRKIFSLLILDPSKTAQKLTDFAELLRLEETLKIIQSHHQNHPEIIYIRGISSAYQQAGSREKMLGFKNINIF